jgi:hypothetical protein
MPQLLQSGNVEPFFLSPHPTRVPVYGLTFLSVASSVT